MIFPSLNYSYQHKIPLLYIWFRSQLPSVSFFSLVLNKTTQKSCPTHDLHFLPSHLLLNPFQPCFYLQHFTATAFIKFTQNLQNAKSTSQFPVVTHIISSIQQSITLSFWHTVFTWLSRLSLLYVIFQLLLNNILSCIIFVIPTPTLCIGFSYLFSIAVIFNWCAMAHWCVCTKNF